MKKTSSKIFVTLTNNPSVSQQQKYLLSNSVLSFHHHPHTTPFLNYNNAIAINKKYYSTAIFTKNSIKKKTSSNHSLFSLHQQQQQVSNKQTFHTTLHSLKEKDPYKILGVPKTATKEEIKKKFKELAKKYHPDINKAADAKEKFAELNGAYQILVDDNKRRMYDMTGSTEEFPGGGGPGGFEGDPFGMGGRGMSREQAEEIFNQFFGRGGPFGGDFESAFGESAFGGMGGRAAKGPRHGSDVRKSIRISLKDAVFGTSKDLRINKATDCGTCGGSGVKPGTKPKTCPTCKGTGTMQMQQGFFLFRSTCETCGGSGQIEESCTSCGGEGHKMEMKTVEVKIPAGVDTGSILRLKGMGSPGSKGGSAGDMFLEIYVEPDRTWTRKGDDLETNVTISLAQAVLGGTIELTTLGDEVIKVNIPSGAQPNDKVVVHGKGIKPKAKFSAGNINVYLNVQIPKQLTQDQRDLFNAYAESETNRNGTYTTNKNGCPLSSLVCIGESLTSHNQQHYCSISRSEGATPYGSQIHSNIPNNQNLHLDLKVVSKEDDVGKNTGSTTLSSRGIRPQSARQERINREVGSIKRSKSAQIFGSNNNKREKKEDIATDPLLSTVITAESMIAFYPPSFPSPKLSSSSLNNKENEENFKYKNNLKIFKSRTKGFRRKTLEEDGRQTAPPKIMIHEKTSFNINNNNNSVKKKKLEKKTSKIDIKPEMKDEDINEGIMLEHTMKREFNKKKDHILYRAGTPDLLTTNRNNNNSPTTTTTRKVTKTDSSPMERRMLRKEKSWTIKSNLPSRDVVSALARIEYVDGSDGEEENDENNKIELFTSLPTKYYTNKFKNVNDYIKAARRLLLYRKGFTRELKEEYVREFKRIKGKLIKMLVQLRLWAKYNYSDYLEIEAIPPTIPIRDIKFVQLTLIIYLAMLRQMTEDDVYFLNNLKSLTRDIKLVLKATGILLLGSSYYASQDIAIKNMVLDPDLKNKLVSFNPSKITEQQLLELDFVVRDPSLNANKFYVPLAALLYQWTINQFKFRVLEPFTKLRRYVDELDKFLQKINTIYP
ncbi:hypothetical protein ABK040_001393 [Willaertia magna]